MVYVAEDHLVFDNKITFNLEHYRVSDFYAVPRGNVSQLVLYLTFDRDGGSQVCAFYDTL